VKRLDHLIYVGGSKVTLFLSTTAKDLSFTHSLLNLKHTHTHTHISQPDTKTQEEVGGLHSINNVLQATFLCQDKQANTIVNTMFK